MHEKPEKNNKKIILEEVRHSEYNTDMKYISTKKASQIWRVSERRIQILCKEGRIPGTIKFQRSWMIPAIAEKPPDMRAKTQHKVFSFKCPVLMMSVYRTPGEADRQLKRLKGEALMVYEANLHYYRGEPIDTVNVIKLLEDSENADTVLAASFILSLSALHTGSIDEWNMAMELQKTFEAADIDIAFKKNAELIRSGLAISMHLTEQCAQWIKNGDETGLPNDSIPLYSYMRTYYLFATGEIDRALGYAECAMASYDFPIITIYLLLISAVIYLQKNDKARAYECTLKATRLAVPDRLIAPLIEWYMPLLGLTGETLASVSKELFLKMESELYNFNANWTRLYNELTGSHITLLLSEREYIAAKLAARGLTNTEIAKSMLVSESTVKTYLKSVFNKLGIGSRREIAKYVH